MRAAAKTWLRIASTSGIRVAAAVPTPVGQRQDIELDAFALIDVLLTIERQVQAVFGERDPKMLSLVVQPIDLRYCRSFKNPRTGRNVEDILGCSLHD